MLWWIIIAEANLLSLRLISNEVIRDLWVSRSPFCRVSAAVSLSSFSSRTAKVYFHLINPNTPHIHTIISFHLDGATSLYIEPQLSLSPVAKNKMGTHAVVWPLLHAALSYNFRYYYHIIYWQHFNSQHLSQRAGRWLQERAASANVWRLQMVVHPNFKTIKHLVILWLDELKLQGKKNIKYF